MRVALYARASTAGQTVDPQLDQLRAYAERRGLAVVSEYTDVATSGARTSRPELDRLMADARRRRFDAIAVVSIDRLGRSLQHLLVLLGEMEALGVDLVALNDGLDTSTPVGRLFFQIRGAFAEYERALARERTKAGLAAARRRGRRLGRPRRLDRAGTERARALRRGGASVREVAAALGVGLGTAQAAVAGVPRGPARP